MWRFQFLGDLCAERDDVSVTLTPRKYTALLAYLALHPARRFSRDELAARFWPDSDAEAGRAALRTALSSLRRDFGADLFDVGTATDTLRLREGATGTDVAEFEALLAQAATVRALPERETAVLDAALALYGGPLLPGIYDDGTVAERERLELLHRQAQVRREVLERDAVARRENREYEASHARARKAEGPALRRLPLYTGPFVGREAEIERLTQILCGETSPRPRFLTLTGPGGIGKTRLAVETANAVAAHFPGAVCFVPLAALSAGEEIGGALADALQVESTGGLAPLPSALLRLRDLGPSLIVLDNLEQMVPHGAAQAAKSLLASLPQTTILLTSRCLIGVEGEREFPVNSLSAESGRQLFREHAQAASAADGTSDETALTALCERLDGIPLAIELCAAWARVLTERQMLDHMDQRFRLLTSRRQDLPPRHQSLHATLEWGCPTDGEMLAFFAALSVFRGGWTLPAALAVGGPNALDHTAALREQSLLLAEPVAAGGGMRYRLLETIREFADEKLSPEARPEAQRRHLHYYEGLAARETPRLGGVGSAAVFAALDLETANFRAAIEFGLTDTPGCLLQALRLVHLMRWCWGMRGHYAPYNAWRVRAYARREELPEADCARVIMEYASQCELPEAETLLTEARDCFDRIGEKDGRSEVRQALAALYRTKGDYPAMEAAYQEAVAICAEAGDQPGVGNNLALYAGSLFALNRTVEARALWKQCRAIGEERGDEGGIAVLNRAEGFSLLSEGRAAESIPFLETALTTFRDRGELWQVMDTLRHLARAQIEVGNPHDALPLIAEALQLSRSRGDIGTTEVLLALEAAARATVQNPTPS